MNETESAGPLLPASGDGVDSGKLFALGMGVLFAWILIMLFCARRELFRRLFLCCSAGIEPPRKSQPASLASRDSFASRRGSTRAASISVSATQHRAELRRASLQAQSIRLEAGTALEEILGVPEGGGSWVLVPSEVEGEMYVCPAGPAPITEESSGAESRDDAPPLPRAKRTKPASITLQAKREQNRTRRAESLRTANRPPLLAAHRPSRTRTSSASIDEVRFHSTTTLT